jgi:8-oxo-dGTP diphosphatase
VAVKLTDEDRAYLATYDMKRFPPTATTVDIVIFTIDELGRFCVLLIRRGAPPHRGYWALPGGFVRQHEDLDAAAARELEEETGIVQEHKHLEQLATYGAPDRDPRGRVFSVAYLAFVPQLGRPHAGSDAKEARLWPVSEVLSGTPPLAFDHSRIVEDAVERAKSKLEYTNLATKLLQEPFTMGDLRRVYEAVWGESLHPANFRRKVLATPGFVVPTGEKASTGRGWTELYRAGSSAFLHPALLRSKR